MSLGKVVERCGPVRRRDGGLDLCIADTPVVCRPSGALWLAGERTLVAADLHLEKGSAYASRGQMLPPYDTRETVGRLAAEIEAMAPDRVVLLGDTFHDSRAPDRLAPDDLAWLRALAAARPFVFIVGNHDIAGPGDIDGLVTPAIRLAGLTLTHEPIAAPAPGEVAGHLHPCARVRGRGGTVRRRCFATDGERIVLPAFGALAGGLNVLDPAFAPLFPRSALALVLGADQVLPVGGRSLVGD